MPVLSESALARAELTQQMRRFGCSVSPMRAATPPRSTGIVPLDRLLPEKGLEPGTLVEWLSDGAGTGAGTLALAVLGELLGTHSTCVVVDPEQTFSPAGCRPLRGHEERMIVVHPENDRDALWVWEQSLRCSGVSVVLGGLDRLQPQAYRRLKLAAETGGGVGLLLRPARHRGQPSWADVRLLVEPLPGRSSQGRTVRLEVVHCRGGLGGSAIELEIDDETSDVRLAPRMAAPASLRFATGA
jgi:protein ImuA